MKSPDDIKKGLECCGKGLTWDETCGMGCPYEGMYITGCSMEISADALALIRQLEATVSEKEKVVAELSGKIGQLEAERDALISDFEQYDELPCALCEHYSKGNDEIPCKFCKNLATPTDEDKVSQWEWRGVQKEDTP